MFKEHSRRFFSSDVVGNDYLLLTGIGVIELTSQHSSVIDYNETSFIIIKMDEIDKENRALLDRAIDENPICFIKGGQFDVVSGVLMMINGKELRIGKMSDMDFMKFLEESQETAH